MSAQERYGGRKGFGSDSFFDAADERGDPRARRRPRGVDGPAVSARDKFGAKKGFGSDAMFDRDDDDDDADARGRDGFDSDRHMVYGGGDSVQLTGRALSRPRAARRPPPPRGLRHQPFPNNNPPIPTFTHRSARRPSARPSPAPRSGSLMPPYY